jgi:hypothetical protein
VTLSTTQLQALKAAIAADQALAALPINTDSAYAIAEAFNAAAAPTFVVWRTDVSATEIGNAWVGTDIDGMTSINMQRLQLLLASSAGGSFDMSRADRRAGFENPFGTNANNASRVAMRASWKRSATRAERLFATGTGSDAAPGSMTFEGSISFADVVSAWGA